jgi:hypothetical protein
MLVTRKSGTSLRELLEEQLTRENNSHLFTPGEGYGYEPFSLAEREALLQPSVDTLTTYDITTFEPVVPYTEQPPAIGQHPAWLRLRLIWLWDKQTHTLNLYLKELTPFIVRSLGNRSYAQPLFTITY